MFAKRLYYRIGLIILVCIGLASSRLLDAWYHNVGYLFLMHSNLSAAFDWFSRSTEPSLGTRLGQVRTSVLAKNFDSAGQLLNSASYRPDMMMSLWLLNTASKFLDSGDAESAIRTLDLMTTSDTTNSILWYRLGVLYENAGAHEKARQAFTIGASHDPAGKLAMGWYYVARSFYKEAGEWQKVIDLLSPIYASVPDKDLVVWYWRESFLFLAGSQEKLGRLSEAEQTYRHLVAIDPTARDGVMHFCQRYLGYLELSRDNWLAAQHDFVVDFDSAVFVHQEAYEQRGWQDLSNLTDWIVSHGKSSDAISIAEQSILNDPMSPGWLVYLGNLNIASCEPDKAREAFYKALVLVPDSLSIPAHLEELSNGIQQCFH
jgi:tetratricopeptide (TPR) repeat protein